MLISTYTNKIKSIIGQRCQLHQSVVSDFIVKSYWKAFSPLCIENTLCKNIALLIYFYWLDTHDSMINATKNIYGHF